MNTIKGLLNTNYICIILKIYSYRFLFVLVLHFLYIII